MRRLEKDGYLDTWRRPKGMGRPEKAYRLTPSAQEFFPSEHTNFTRDILTSLEQVYGPAAPEKILYQIYQNHTVKMQARVTGSTLEERARSFATLRDQDGYMSEYYFNTDLSGTRSSSTTRPCWPSPTSSASSRSWKIRSSKTSSASACSASRSGCQRPVQVPVHAAGLAPT